MDRNVVLMNLTKPTRDLIIPPNMLPLLYLVIPPMRILQPHWFPSGSVEPVICCVKIRPVSSVILPPSTLVTRRRRHYSWKSPQLSLEHIWQAVGSCFPMYMRGRNILLKPTQTISLLWYSGRTVPIVPIDVLPVALVSDFRRRWTGTSSAVIAVMD